MIDEFKIQSALGTISSQFFLDYFDEIQKFLEICRSQQVCIKLHEALDLIVLTEKLYLVSDDDDIKKIWRLRRLAYDKIRELV